MGVKPSDLLPMALASCSGVDVVDVLGKGDGELTRLEIEVSFTKEPDRP